MKRHTVVGLCATLVLVACSQSAEAERTVASIVVAPASAVGTTVADAKFALPRMIVTKSPTCGCCASWVEHARHAGFEVHVEDVENPYPVKERLGVPLGKGSCHTAQIGGYFIEGHVPLDDVKRLLAEKPDARGLVVPGMPAGSPGMEMPDGRVQPYTVELVARDGTTSVFARHDGR